MTVRRGALIVLEGCDKAGKSTQARMLVDSVRKLGIKTRLMNFPDRSTGIGKIIDEYLKKQVELTDEAVHLLFSANRWELVPEIMSTLSKGETILIDRYAYSGIAFSSAKGLPLNWCRNPDVGLPKPDAVIYLNLDEKTASTRGDYGQERYENMDFQQKVKEVFFKLRDDSWRMVDASRSVDIVHQDCQEIIMETIKQKEHQPMELLWQNRDFSPK